MVISLAAEGGLFDSFGGLPIHPLVVHLAVIVLPLSALGMAVLVFVRPWRARFGWLTLVGLAVGTVAAVVAKESGEALAHHVGEPQDHARYGDVLPLVAAALFVVAAGWFLLQRRADRVRVGAGGAGGIGGAAGAAQQPEALPRLLGLATAALAVGTIVLTVLTGHTGAQAVWGGVVTNAVGAPASSDNATPSTTPSSTPTTTTATSSLPTTTTTPPATTTTSGPPVPAAGYTKAAVAQHNSATSCWTIVNGSVYDLTSWIDQHLGGRDRILGICGIDGTAQFVAQHGTVGRAVRVLATYQLGPLSS